MNEEESSLKTLFLLAKRQQEKLDSLEPRSEDFINAQQSAIKALEDCRELIIKIALYSVNEDSEDISTHDLQYLAIDYLLAEMLLTSYKEDRLGQIRQASELLGAFLMRLDQYDLLSKAEQKLFERYQENKQSFSVVSTTNAEERRNIKVARFREEKALKDRLKLLRAQSNANHVDDETVRNLYLAELTLYVHQTFQSLDLISQELSILSQMRHAESTRSTNPGGDSRDRSRNGDAYSERLDGPITMGGLGRKGGPLLSPGGKPLQPFTLTDKRTQLQNGVFRSGHNLPTMSIDEYLEEEKKRGGIIEGGGNANTAQPEPDEDNMDLVDAATMKARDWDEFVEANPKGAGNTLNRG